MHGRASSMHMYSGGGFCMFSPCKQRQICAASVHRHAEVIVTQVEVCGGPCILAQACLHTHEGAPLCTPTNVIHKLEIMIFLVQPCIMVGLYWLEGRIRSPAPLGRVQFQPDWLRLAVLHERSTYGINCDVRWDACVCKGMGVRVCARKQLYVRHCDELVSNLTFAVCLSIRVCGRVVCSSSCTCTQKSSAGGKLYGSPFFNSGRPRFIFARLFLCLSLYLSYVAVRQTKNSFVSCSWIHHLKMCALAFSFSGPSLFQSHMTLELISVCCIAMGNSRLPSAHVALLCHPAALYHGMRAPFHTLYEKVLSLHWSMLKVSWVALWHVEYDHLCVTLGPKKSIIHYQKVTCPMTPNFLTLWMRKESSLWKSDIKVRPVKENSTLCSHGQS